MGDWADFMEMCGGVLPRDIGKAQMVPGYYVKPKRKKKAKTVGASTAPKSDNQPEKS